MVKSMKLKDIIISDDFKTTQPAKWKLAKCRKHYQATKTFDRDIILNEDNMLIDGYVAYLVAQENGIEDVDVVYGLIDHNANNIAYIYARHQPNGRKYIWRVTNRTINIAALKVGSVAVVDTQYGPREVVVCKVKWRRKRPKPYKFRRVFEILSNEDVEVKA
jgi:hypothetical protein